MVPPVNMIMSFEGALFICGGHIDRDDVVLGDPTALFVESLAFGICPAVHSVCNPRKMRQSGCPQPKAHSYMIYLSRYVKQYETSFSHARSPIATHALSHDFHFCSWPLLL